MDVLWPPLVQVCSSLECVREIQDDRPRLAVRTYGATTSNQGVGYGPSELYFSDPTPVRSIATELTARAYKHRRKSNPQQGEAARWLLLVSCVGEPEFSTTTAIPSLRQSTSPRDLNPDPMPEAIGSSVSISEISEQLASGERVLLRESSFSGLYRGIPIVGRPDLVFFNGMRPHFLVDYKFSTKRETYPDHRLQVALYGMLLHQNKFETEGLVTIIAFVLRAVAEGHLESGLLKIYQRLRETALAQQRQTVHQDQDVACFAYPFDLKQAKRLVDEQTDFWLGLRSAVPTRPSRKCSVCEFNAAGLCESALTPPVPKP
jgi:PD-(D/E)XK nuclease superfamily